MDNPGREAREKMTNYLYFDYEADQSGTFYLLGQRYRGHTAQWVLDRTLDAAADAKGLAVGEVGWVTEELLELALRSSAVLVAYSTAEANYLKTLFEGEIPERYQGLSYLNMAKAAKHWVRRNHAERFVALGDYASLQHRGQPAYVRNQINHSLASRMRLTDFPPPGNYGIRRVMAKLNYVISALVRHQQNFEKISRGAKKKWTEALIHNCYDVEAMEVLRDVIHHEDKKCLDWATKTLGEM